MAATERAPQPVNPPGSLANVIEFGPPVADRIALESAPSAATIDFYLLTEAATRAWGAISASQTSNVSRIFWVSGPAAAGKTHFLNYVMALEERAAAYDIEQRMFESLAREIGGGDAGAMLWRRLHGGEALGVALEQAYRVGIRAVIVAIDFGAADAAAWDGYFAELGRVAARSRDVAFNVYVAARNRPPASAVALEVAPADGRERMLAALAQTRRVIDEAAAAALYDSRDVGGFDARAIFPFDPRAIETLGTLAGETASVPALAKLAASALAAFCENAADGCHRPLLAFELLDAAPVAKRAQERLGQAGCAALRIAHSAADAMEERGCARGIVDALMLAGLGGGEGTLSLGELRLRLPERYQRRGPASAAGAAVAARRRSARSRRLQSRAPASSALRRDAERSGRTGRRTLPAESRARRDGAGGRSGSSRRRCAGRGMPRIPHGASAGVSADHRRFHCARGGRPRRAD
jgi:hypothetical protein